MPIDVMLKFVPELPKQAPSVDSVFVFDGKDYVPVVTEENKQDFPATLAAMRSNGGHLDIGLGVNGNVYGLNGSTKKLLEKVHTNASRLAFLYGRQVEIATDYVGYKG